MSAKPALLLFVIVVVLAGCGGGSTDRPAAPPTPKPQADGSMSVVAFNGYLNDNGPTESSPLVLTTQYLHLEQGEATPAGLTQVVPPEGGRSARVIVRLGPLLDDSVRLRRYELAFERREDGSWRLRTARWSQRCQRGRGHQDFTPALCV